MKIDKYLHKIKIENFQAIKKMLDQTDNSPHKKNTNNHSNEKTKNPQTNINTKIFSLLEQLNPEQQKKLLNTFLKMNLPLNEDNVTKLINLINTKSINIKSEALIKALAVMQKGGLNLNTELMEGISKNLDPASSQVENIIEIITNNEKNMINNLLIDPSVTKDELSKNLKNYTLNLDENIKNLFFSNKEINRPENKLLNQFLGQKLINNQETNLLLALELPLYWADKNKIYPSYLQVWSNNEKNNKLEKKEYNIAFSIKLKNRGLIDALLKIQSKNIKAYFKSNNKKTVELIKKENNNLKKSLENIGYNFSLEVKQEEEEILKNKITLDLNFKENEEKSKNKDYHHIDVKI